MGLDDIAVSHCSGAYVQLRVVVYGCGNVDGGVVGMAGKCAPGYTWCGLGQQCGKIRAPCHHTGNKATKTLHVACLYSSVTPFGGLHCA